MCHPAVTDPLTVAFGAVTQILAGNIWIMGNGSEIMNLFSEPSKVKLINHKYYITFFLV